MSAWPARTICVAGAARLRWRRAVMTASPAGGGPGRWRRGRRARWWRTPPGGGPAGTAPSTARPRRPRRSRRAAPTRRGCPGADAQQRAEVHDGQHDDAGQQEGGQGGGDQPRPTRSPRRVAGEERDHRDRGQGEQDHHAEPARGAAAEEQPVHRRPPRRRRTRTMTARPVSALGERGGPGDAVAGRSGSARPGRTPSRPSANMYRQTHVVEGQRGGEQRGQEQPLGRLRQARRCPGRTAARALAPPRRRPRAPGRRGRPSPRPRRRTRTPMAASAV